MTTYDSLPELAKTFIKTIEEITKCKVKYIGVGPKNEDMIIRDNI